MSRRKQSNPKPIKRKSEDELEELAKTLHLPANILHIYESDDNHYMIRSSITLPKGSSFGPFKAQVVPEHSDTKPDHVIQFPGNTTGNHSNISLVTEEDQGSWLKFMKRSPDPDECNAIVTLQDSNIIWCEITQDIAENEVLLACFANEGVSADTPERAVTLKDGAPIKESLDTMDVISSQTNHIKVEVDSSHDDQSKGSSSLSKGSLESESAIERDTLKMEPKSPVSSTSELTEDSEPVVKPKLTHSLRFCCMNCGVKFSNPSTLEAHATFYCTKRHLVAPSIERNSISPESGMSESKSEDGLNYPTKAISPSLNQDSVDQSDNSIRENGDQEFDDAKSIKAFKCNECTYSADKRTSLNRHMRIHGANDDKSEPKAKPLSKDELAEMRCNNCNIQFTSKKTFWGHKEYYCQLRHRKPDHLSPTQAKTPSSESSISPPPTASNHLQQMAAVMSSHNAPGYPNVTALSASQVVTPEQIASIQSQSSQMTVVVATPVVSPDGSTSIVNVPTVIMQPVIAPLPNMVKAHQKESASSSKCPAEQPLDLSVKKEPQSPPQERISVKSPSINSPRKPVPGYEQPHDLSTKSGPSSPRSLSTPGSAPVTPVSPSAGHNWPTPGVGLKEKTTQRPSSHSVASMLSPGSGGSLSPPSTPGSQAPIQGISKCMDCNIVFYKHENYVIHKEHYCSGRRVRRPVIQQQMIYDQNDVEPKRIKLDHPPPDDSTSREKPISPKENSPLQAVPPKFLQFYCVPCKIKFSSPDTLKAHQQYYCPYAGIPAEIPTAQEVKANMREDSPDEPGPEYGCMQCGNIYPSSRLLKAHHCAILDVQLVACPHCDYVAQSDQRLIEHLKAHSPSKAYKCTICGYRGNTVRGMRMHGKMHIDAGEQFTDENMIEFEEPPLIPKLLRHRPSQPITNGAQMEAELIRIKNEPYKRRRSRKSYEKAEHIPGSNIPLRRHAPHMCVTCNQVFSDTTKLRAHMRIHEEESLQFACKQCDYIVNSKANLVRHVKVVHELYSRPWVNEGQNDSDKEANQQDDDNPKENTIPRTHNSPSEPIRDNHRERTPSGEPLHKHIKVENNNLVDNGDERTNQDMFKTEKVNGAILSRPASRSSAPRSPVVKVETPQPVKANGSHLTQEEILQRKNDKSSAMYCQKCDITFMYYSSFIAHKKYYCMSHNEENIAQQGEPLSEAVA
ncbi:unnamed protein product [Owenia fusiformis]|uniref:Uncharacterized protein n=1 Tax=Owenia fusiformis TaxID=6347 RepID=A0A8J1Y9P8_OWEFU|nr:unnamed protein product [Owenia fusiformis]